MYRYVRNPDPRKKPPYGSRINPTHPLSQGLVGCWLFNEGGGKILYDQTGLHKLELVSGTWGISSGGQAFIADYTVPDYVECTNLSSELTSQQTGTLVVIHQPTANVAGSLFSLADALDANHWGLVVNAGNDSTGRAVGVIFVRFNSSSWGIIKETTEEIFSVGDLCTWAVSQDGAGIKFYAEGKEKNLQDAYGKTSSDATSWIGDVYGVNRLRLGYMADSTPDHPYDGYIITEFEYNRALSEGEIAQLHAEPYAHILVPQYWHMVDFISTGGNVYEVSVMLGSGLGLSSSATAAASASVNLDSSLGVEQGNQAEASAVATLAELLGVSANAVAFASGSVTLGKVLSITCHGELEGAVEVAVTLTNSLGISASATATAYGALDLAYALALGAEAKADATAVLALAMQQGISCTFEVGTAVSVELSQKLGLDASATATTLGTLTLDQTLGISVLALAMAQAGVSLDSVMELTVSGSTISASLITPDARTYKVNIEVRSYKVEVEDRICKIKKEM